MAATKFFIPTTQAAFPLLKRTTLPTTTHAAFPVLRATTLPTTTQAAFPIFKHNITPTLLSKNSRVTTKRTGSVVRWVAYGGPPGPFHPKWLEVLLAIVRRFNDDNGWLVTLLSDFDGTLGLVQRLGGWLLWVLSALGLTPKKKNEKKEGSYLSLQTPENEEEEEGSYLSLQTPKNEEEEGSYLSLQTPKNEEEERI